MSDKTIAERVATLEQCQRTTARDIADIKLKLLGRPSWSVSVIITLLTTLSVALMVFILTK